MDKGFHLIWIGRKGGNNQKENLMNDKERALQFHHVYGQLIQRTLFSDDITKLPSSRSAGTIH